MLILKKVWFRPELNWRPSACKADVITTTLRNHSLPCKCFFFKVHSCMYVCNEMFIVIGTQEWLYFATLLTIFLRVGAKTHTNHLTGLVAITTMPPLNQRLNTGSKTSSMIYILPHIEWSTCNQHAQFQQFCKVTKLYTKQLAATLIFKTLLGVTGSV